jgi:hypothetical protein
MRQIVENNTIIDFLAQKCVGIFRCSRGIIDIVLFFCITLLQGRSGWIAAHFVIARAAGPWQSRECEAPLRAHWKSHGATRLAMTRLEDFRSFVSWFSSDFCLLIPDS